jgi:Flp pilus assembly protein TadD
VLWLAAMLTVAFRLARFDSVISLGLVWFLLILVPSAVLVILNLGEPMAEHRAYLAAAGFFLAVGRGVGHIWNFFDTRTTRSRLLLRLCLAAWLTVLGGLTVLRNEVWANPVRLWRDAAEKAPAIWVPHLMLGAALQEQGSTKDAVVAYRRALSLRPVEKVTYMRLGLALAELGQLDDARATFERLLTLDPTAAVGHNGLGAVATLQGRHDDARTHYEAALRYHPEDVAARQSLAMLQEAVWHNPAEALRLCEEVRRIAPKTPDVDDCIARNRAALESGTTR